MSRPNKIKIEMEVGKFPSITYDSPIGQTQKTVFPSRILDVLQQVMTGGEDPENPTPKEHTILASPELPIGTVRYGQSSRGKDYLFLVDPASQHDVKYDTFQFEDVGFPSLVFFFAIQKGNLSAASVAAYKDRFLRPDTQLYRFPYSNVHADTQLCFWTNEQIADLVRMQTFPYEWKSLNNNGHLYRPGSSNLSGLTQYDLYKLMENKPFDPELLAPINKTFQQWSDGLMQSNNL